MVCRLAYGRVGRIAFQLGEIHDQSLGGGGMIYSGHTAKSITDSKIRDDIWL